MQVHHYYIDDHHAYINNITMDDIVTYCDGIGPDKSILLEPEFDNLVNGHNIT